MGLVNGIGLDDRRLAVLINVVLLVTMAVVDTNKLRDRARRMDVTLDTVHTDEAALVADLESKLGGQVMRHEVNQVDYVRQTMIVDVRYRAGTRPVEQRLDERTMEVTLDVIHTEESALVADLERRLGGQVLRHQVKDVDYVRDIMVVDVRFRTWPHRSGLRLAGATKDGQAVNGQLTDAALADNRTVVIQNTGARS
jgi:hypothetical protein